MKKTLIALALFACAAAASATPALSQKPEMHLQFVGTGGGSGDINGGGSGGLKMGVVNTPGVITKMDMAANVGPPGKNHQRAAKAVHVVLVPKTGQFTVGGQYVAGVHISQAWGGNVYL